ncbi:MAG: hypothetical protein ACRCTZ_21690 [Sarcina sp.]
MGLIEILENRLDEVSMYTMDGPELDTKFGYKESLNFCIRKHQEGWTLDLFKTNLIETLDKYGKYYGDYTSGLISGLKYNIKIMEEHNE